MGFLSIMLIKRQPFLWYLQTLMFNSGRVHFFKLNLDFVCCNGIPDACKIWDIKDSFTTCKHSCWMAKTLVFSPWLYLTSLANPKKKGGGAFLPYFRIYKYTASQCIIIYSEMENNFPPSFLYVQKKQNINMYPSPPGLNLGFWRYHIDRLYIQF